MGVYYHPNNKKVEELLPNYWGADFYGLLYRYAVEGHRETKFDNPMPRLPYSATAEAARSIAAKLRETRENDFAGLVDYLDRNGMLRHLEKDPEAPTKEEFVTGFVDELVKFLEECEGYDAD